MPSWVSTLILGSVLGTGVLGILTVLFAVSAAMVPVGRAYVKHLKNRSIGIQLAPIDKAPLLLAMGVVLLSLATVGLIVLMAVMNPGVDVALIAMGLVGSGLCVWLASGLRRDLSSLTRRSRQSTVQRDWFLTLAFLIPKQIREPWYGDLCEDRRRMVVRGRSRTFVGLATAIQLLLLLATWLKALAMDVVTGASRRAE